MTELLVGNYLVVAQGSQWLFVSEYMLFKLSLERRSRLGLCFNKDTLCQALSMKCS